MGSRWLTILLGMLLFAGCAGPTTTSATVTSGFKGIELTTPYTIPDVTLTDTSGKPFDIRTSPQRPIRILFFGYSHCPDICPGVLADLASAVNRVSPDVRSQLEVIFVTTDPPRDTPSVMREYLDRFDPDFTGLTGDMSTIMTLADAVGIGIAGTQKLPSGGYEVDHTASVIGVDRQGQGRVVWTVGTPIGDLKQDFERLVAAS